MILFPFSLHLVSSNIDSFLLLHKKWPQMQWLKIAHVCYLTVSVGQKSGHSLGESSVHCLTKLQSRCWLGCVFNWRLNGGRICLQAHSGRSQDSFPCGYKTEGPAFFWLLAGGRLPAVPCHMEFSKQVLTSSNQQGESPGFRECLIPLSRVFN